MCSAAQQGRFSIHSAVASGKPGRSRAARGRSTEFECPLGIIISPHQAGPERRAGLSCPPGPSQRALSRAEGAGPSGYQSDQQALGPSLPSRP